MRRRVRLRSGQRLAPLVKTRGFGMAPLFVVWAIRFVVWAIRNDVRLGWAIRGRGSVMKYWERFKTYKERGEWVELLFMAAAAGRGFAVCMPWGETKAYDVGIEHGLNFLRCR